MPVSAIPARTTAVAAAVSIASPGAASAGSSSIIGTSARSWKSRMPAAACPDGASSSPRPASILNTNAVLDSATRKPATTASGPGVPIARMMAAVNATLTITCTAPPTTRKVTMRLSFSRENSIPTPNSSSATPISASASMLSECSTRPRIPGPASTPAKRYTTMGGTPMRRPNMRSVSGLPRKPASSNPTTATPSSTTTSRRIIAADVADGRPGDQLERPHPAAASLTRPCGKNAACHANIFAEGDCRASNDGVGLV